ncbi:MAG: hypothetical protein HY811_08305 [Planctomycetes bacterium]|nr:hypothetical protein [Planctomycetota bacterium]
MGMHQPVDMFDPQKIIQEVFKLNKAYWLNSMEMMAAFQDQAMSVVNTMMEQGMVTQQGSRKAFQDWLEKAKEAQEEYAETMKTNLKKAEAMFNPNAKTEK